MKSEVSNKHVYASARLLEFKWRFRICEFTTITKTFSIMFYKETTIDQEMDRCQEIN